MRKEGSESQAKTRGFCSSGIRRRPRRPGKKACVTDGNTTGELGGKACVALTPGPPEAPQEAVFWGKRSFLFFFSFFFFLRGD